MWAWLQRWFVDDVVMPGDVALDPDGVRQVLSTLDDPELGVDIVSLGLVRDVTAGPRGVAVLMTLTTPACPVGPWLQGQATERLRTAFPEVADIDVRVVLDPPWSPAEMSSSARTLLGYAPF